jgi:hypothetical protein
VNTRSSNSSGCLCVRMNNCIVMWWLSWQCFMNLRCTRNGGLGSSVGLVWSCLWTDQTLPNCWEHKYIYIPDTLHVHTNTIKQSIWLPTEVAVEAVGFLLRCRCKDISWIHHWWCYAQTPSTITKCIKYNVGDLEMLVNQVWCWKA